MVCDKVVCDKVVRERWYVAKLYVTVCDKVVCDEVVCVCFLLPLHPLFSEMAGKPASMLLSMATRRTKF